MFKKRFGAFMFVLAVLVTVCLGDDWQPKRAKSAFTMSTLIVQATPDTSSECPDCYGTGKRGDGRVVFKCPTCGGTGKKKAAGSAPAASAVSESFDEVFADESPVVQASDPDVYGILFSATWCQPCAKMKKEELPKLSMVLQELDVDKEKEAFAKTGRGAVPVVVFCDRILQTTLITAEGYQTAEQIEDLAEQAKKIRIARAEANTANISKATVRISSRYMQNGKQFIGIGSGTIIRNDKRRAWVLTCEHVVPPGSFDLDVEAANVFPGVLFRGEVVVRDARTDLAIISFKHDRDEQLVAMGDVAGTNPECLAAVVHGYLNGGKYAEIDATTKTPKEWSGVRMAMIDRHVEDGVSGGALTVDGTIVGVASFISKAEVESAFADVESIKAIRRKAGL